MHKTKHKSYFLHPQQAPAIKTLLRFYTHATPELQRVMYFASICQNFMLIFFHTISECVGVDSLREVQTLQLLGLSSLKLHFLSTELF